MMPPECTYCGRDQAEYPDLGFDLIYFKPTAEDDAWHMHAMEEGTDGHPPNAFWFCNDHIEKAKKHQSLNAKVALMNIGDPDQISISTDSYFKSPKEAVAQITEMLINEDWEKLLGFYDLSNCDLLPIQFLSGRFFIRTEAPEVAHPGGFWKYKHPFAPGFTFDYALAKENITTVHLCIEIDQGDGRIQKGADTFELINHPDKGYKIIPPETEVDS